MSFEQNVVVVDFQGTQSYGSYTVGGFYGPAPMKTLGSNTVDPNSHLVSSVTLSFSKENAQKFYDAVSKIEPNTNVEVRAFNGKFKEDGSLDTTDKPVFGTTGTPTQVSAPQQQYGSAAYSVTVNLLPIEGGQYVNGLLVGEQSANHVKPDGTVSKDQAKFFKSMKGEGFTKAALDKTAGFSAEEIKMAAGISVG